MEFDPSEDQLHAVAIGLDVNATWDDLKRNSSAIFKFPPKEGQPENRKTQHPFFIKLHEADSLEDQRFALAFALAKVEMLGDDLPQVTLDNHKSRFRGAEFSGPGKDEILIRALEMVLPTAEFLTVFKEVNMEISRVSAKMTVPVSIVNLRLESLGIGRRGTPARDVSLIDQLISSAEVKTIEKKSKATDSGFGVRTTRVKEPRRKRAVGM